MGNRGFENKQVSIIIPVYNEAGNIVELYNELIVAIGSLKESCEIIFVNDGSTDETLEILNQLYESKKDDIFKVINLSKRFGQMQALKAGIDNAQGEILVLLDGDLQNDPKDISLFISKLNEGWDLVNGWRKERKDPFFSKCLPSLVANFLIRRISKVKLHDFGCTLKVFKKKVLGDYLILSSKPWLFSPYVALKGYRITEIVISHRKRISGKSKYNCLRIYELIAGLFRIYLYKKSLINFVKST